MALLSTDKHETSVGWTIDYIDHCHPYLLKYRLLISTDKENARVLLEIKIIS